MSNSHNPLLRKAEWFRYCIHLTNLNLSHIKLVEAMGLKGVASRSLAKVSAAYKKIPYKSIKTFKSYFGGGGWTHRQRHTHVQTDW
jgi:hypothetical protein